MTVSSEISKSGPYNGNGSTRSFAYDFRILDASHISVVRTVNNVDTILTTGFTVTNVGNDVGGNVTFTTAPAVGQQITLIRNAPFTQSTDLENQGAFYAQTVEDAFDLAVMRDQELAEQLSRAVKLPVGQSAVNTDELAADIIRVADSAGNVDTVAANIGSVNTVSINIGNVNVVSGNIADVTNFAKVYLGPKSAAPTVRNDGTALLTGDLYFNTTSGIMFVRHLGAWVASGTAAGLQASLNLSDVPNKAVAAQNLLGTAALSARPLYTLRVNAAGDGYELRTVTQTRADLGIIGIGNDTAPTVSDLNALAIGGQYFATSTTVGLPLSEAGFIYHSQGNVVDRAFQVYSGFNSERQFFRTNQAGTWSGWKEVPTVISMNTAIAAYAPPAPVTATGAGQWRSLRAGPSVALVLPSGGTWSWFLVRRDTTGAITTSDAGVSAGGTTIAASGASFIYEAFCWRIA